MEVHAHTIECQATTPSTERPHLPQSGGRIEKASEGRAPATAGTAGVRAQERDAGRTGAAGRGGPSQCNEAGAEGKRRGRNNYATADRRGAEKPISQSGPSSAEPTGRRDGGAAGGPLSAPAEAAVDGRSRGAGQVKTRRVVVSSLSKT